MFSGYTMITQIVVLKIIFTLNYTRSKKVLSYLERKSSYKHEIIKFASALQELNHMVFPGGGLSVNV